MKFEIAIISLEDSPRRNYIKVIPEYFINAVNAKHFSLDALQSKIKFHTGKEFMSCKGVPINARWKIKIAIFLSHLKSLRWVVQVRYERSKLVIPPLLILEDDFKIDYDSPRDIPIPEPPEDWEILFLGGSWSNKKGHTEKPVTGWNLINHTKIKWWTCSGYIVRDPVKLLQNIRSFGYLTSLENYYNRWIYKSMKSYYLYPSVVRKNDFKVIQVIPNFYMGDD